MNYVGKPSSNHATVRQLPNPGLFIAIVGRDQIQRGTFEYHPLGDFRIDIGDFMPHHAPTEKAITWTLCCVSIYFFVAFADALEADFLGSSTSIDSSKAFGSNLLGHASSSSELTTCMS